MQDFLIHGIAPVFVDGLMQDALIVPFLTAVNNVPQYKTNVNPTRNLDSMALKGSVVCGVNDVWLKAATSETYCQCWWFVLRRATPVGRGKNHPAWKHHTTNGPRIDGDEAVKLNERFLICRGSGRDE